MLLDGKKLVITGVLTKDSIAAGVARLAQDEGAEIVLTSFGRGLRLTERVARTLPTPPDVLELDVTSPDDHTALAEELGRRWGKVDGALHAVGFAPEPCLGQDEGLLAAEWEDVATALHVSSYSLKSLAQTLAPLMPDGGSLVALDFDPRQVWPAYDWMGVAKAALEATARYLARDLGSLGIRILTIAPSLFSTGLTRGIPDEFAAALTKDAPFPKRMGRPEEYARLAVAIVENPMLNGQCLRLDAGTRFAPK